uniref:Uncharacterized protein n=1 Tax=Catagonus wagneri TaxID=51154 RepID=A0A8C3W0M2_9CETA
MDSSLKVFDPSHLKIGRVSPLSRLKRHNFLKDHKGGKCGRSQIFTPDNLTSKSPQPVFRSLQDTSSRLAGVQLPGSGQRNLWDVTRKKTEPSYKLKFLEGLR